MGGIASCGDCGGAGREPFAVDDGGAPAADGGEPRGFPEASVLTSCDESVARKSPLGCEYVAFIYRLDHVDRGCHALVVSNPGDDPARLTLEREGKPVDLARSARRITGAGRNPAFVPVDDDTVPPGASVAIVIVQGDPSTSGLVDHCAIPPIVEDPHAGVDTNGTASAFHLVSSAPVFVTQRMFYGMSKEVALGAAPALRASGSWASSNVDVGVYRPGRPAIQANEGGASFDESYGDWAGFVMVAGLQDTHVSFVGDAGAFNVPLRAGEVYRARRDDLFIGTRIESERPVALLVGTEGSFIPYNVGFGQPLFMTVAPPIGWGHEYAAVRYPDRYPGTVEPILYRIVAEREGTTLAYDPAPPPGAPTSMHAGELAVVQGATPFVVRSQDEAHRFHLSMMMTGAETVMPLEDRMRLMQGRGGPHVTAIPPPEEFASRFAFATDHSFSDTHLVLVRKQTAGVFGDVTLDCVGKVEGWSPIGTEGTYETVTLTLSAGSFEPQVYPGGVCDNGAHVLTSEGLVSGFVWAWTHAGAWPEDPESDTNGASYVFPLFGLPRRSDASQK